MALELQPFLGRSAGFEVPAGVLAKSNGSARGSEPTNAARRTPCPSPQVLAFARALAAVMAADQDRAPPGH
jgi:hypothetical protein